MGVLEMTTLREAAQQALEALKLSTPDDYAEQGWKEHNATITALRAALAEPVQEPWTDADADAARLAMELEALLLSCKDTAAVSRWWDSAHDALELHRQRLSMDGLANQQKTSGSPCPTCEALARAVMMDQTGKA